MRAAALRVPALVAIATGAGIAGALPALWARPEELADRVAIALVILTYAATSLVILIARPDNRVARLLIVGTIAWAAGELLLAWGVEGWANSDPAVPGAAHATVIGTAVRGAGWLVLVLGVPLVFPDGKTAWPRRRAPQWLLGLAIGSLVLGSILAPYPLESRVGHLASPTGLPLTFQVAADLLALGALGLAAATLVLAIVGLRLKWQTADPLGRQQLIWFAVAFSLPLFCLPLAATPYASPWLFAAVSAPAPIALAVALLQRRLYDIELAISRSLTFILVSVAAIAVYAATVATVGILLRRPGAEWLPWVGAAVLALVFTPLRIGVRSVANRVTYGHWSSPADVLAATERRLRDAVDLPALLDAMVAEVADLLRLPHLAVVDAHGSVVSSVGEPPAGPTEELPLTAFAAPVGTLRWASTPLGAADRRLLTGVGRQLAEALHAATMVEELRRAQERLVIAREAERKRLRRDLHDGLGPSLAALGLQVDGLRNRIRALGPEATDGELVALRSGIQLTVAEVRRVVEGLRPPALDELGLSGAVQQLAYRLASQSESAEAGPVTIDASVNLDDLPELPAATEVAAYRIAQEALTNAIRHAGAARVWLSITVESQYLVVQVCDDGHGDIRPRDGGVGLSAMRERAEELGGSLEIAGEPAAGTMIRARLPLPALLQQPVPVRSSS
ncbi:MAG TPA: sensor histidine kinase [Arachnia sp.]|nr:sensor histidine kinase [Arachnia sp.]